MRVRLRIENCFFFGKERRMGGAFSLGCIQLRRSVTMAFSFFHSFFLFFFFFSLSWMRKVC